MTRNVSLLSMGAGARLMLAGLAIAAVWAVVLWALQ